MIRKDTEIKCPECNHVISKCIKDMPDTAYKKDMPIYFNCFPEYLEVKCIRCGTRIHMGILIEEYMNEQRL